MKNTSIDWSQLSPFRREIILSLLAIGLFLNILILVIPIYSLQVFDRVLTSRSLDTLFLISLIAIFLLSIQAGLDVIKNRYLQQKATKLDALISSHLFQQIGNKSLDNQASLQDIKELRTFMISPAFSVVFDIIWIPLFVVVMFILHPMIGVVGLVAVVSVGGFSLFSHYSKANQISQAQQINQATLHAQTEAQQQTENLASQHLIEGLSRQYQHLTAERVWHDQQLNQRTSILTSAAKYIRFVLQMAIMAAGAALVIENSMSAGGIIAGSILMSRALQPLEQLASALQAWHSSLQANKRVKNYFTNQVKHGEDTQFSDVRGSLHIDGVSWLPDHHTKPLLKNIRLKLEPGNRVAITGSSGSGKTTLCKLLVGLLKPNAGSINIDGASLPQWSSQQLRDVVGYVPQQVQFMTGSIKQNIAHFDPNMQDDQVISAANKIGIHQDIVKLPQGYNTVIGQHGIPISHGLAQGIAIARALYFEPKLIIFDEANAYLDSQKLKLFKQLLDDLAKQSAAVVVVTHNVSLFQHVDWLVELEAGEIKSANPTKQISKIQPLKKAASNG